MRSFGLGRACQFCAQVEGLPGGIQLSSVGRRFGAYLLESVLMIVTLGIGWLIWALIVFGKGQTPAKQLLGMRLVILETGRPAGWGRTFLRESFVKGIIGAAVGWMVFPYFWLLWDKDRQELWD